MIRVMKIMIVLTASILCLFYATNNIANLDQMYGALAYVLGNQEHQVYPDAFGPAVTSPVLIWIAVVIVLSMEYGTGILLLLGAWAMFGARGRGGDDFQGAKEWALVGCLLGVLTWFGLFMTLGGAYFQMWQTVVGAGSNADAFRFAAMLGLIFLIVQARDE